MSANFEICKRGWGERPLWAASAESRSGGQGYVQGLSSEEQELLDGIQGDLATEKPQLVETQFPGPIAEAAYWDDATVVGIQGPVGSGKTTTVLKSRLRRAACMPRSAKPETHYGITGHWRRYKLLIVRQTYRLIWSTTIPDFIEVFPKHLGNWQGGRGGPVTFSMVFEDDAGPIEFVAEFMAFNDDIVTAMRGYQVTDIWLHEMDTNPEDVLSNGITRIGRFPKKSHFKGYPPQMQSYKQIVGDFNAPDEDNWTFPLFHDEENRMRVLKALNAKLPDDAAKIEISFYRQPGYNEPGCENLQNLDPTYYQSQVALLTAQGKGDHIDRLVYNKVTYLRQGDPVFAREFSRRIHVSEDRIEPWEDCGLRIGLDQGFKGAAVLVQFRPPYHWQVLSELHYPDERLMATTFGQRLREHIDMDPRIAGMRIEGAWGDMAGEHGASQAASENHTWNNQVSAAANITVMPQRMGTNQINPRLEQVRAALEFMHAGRAGMLIDPSCKFLIRGFQARYVWAEQINASGDKRKVPDKSKTEANVHDALQYVLLSEAKPGGTSPMMHQQAIDNLRDSYASGGPELTTQYDPLAPYGADQPPYGAF